MKIFNQVLITNDDGYKSEGINFLKQILKKMSREVYTVAPLKNESAKGRSITLGKKINFFKLSDFDWAIEGTPTDAMIFALNKIFKKKLPDYIFSGINDGTNIGDEISYSGTVGAAYEGSLRNVPSIALSQVRRPDNKRNFEVIEEYLPKILSKIKELDFTNKGFFNVNFPNCKSNKIKDILITKICHNKISDEIYVNLKTGYFEIGDMIVKNINDMESDFYAIKNNSISITPIVLNFTNTLKLDV